MEEGSEHLVLSSNPFTDAATIGMQGKFSMTIANMDGKTVEEHEAENEMRIGQNLTPGNYILRVVKNGKLYIRKISKK